MRIDRQAKTPAPQANERVTITNANFLGTEEIEKRTQFAHAAQFYY